MPARPGPGELEFLLDRKSDFSNRGQTAKYFRFWGPLDVTAMQLCCCSLKAAIDDTKTNVCDCVPGKLYLQKQAAGWICPGGRSLLMLVLHRRGSPSPDLVLLCTMILLAAIFDMVQLEGDLEMLAAGDSSKPEETESWVFTPCGPTVMGTQLPGVLWCPLSFPRVRLQGCGVTRVQVGLWVRPLTELTSPRLWFGASATWVSLLL